MKHRWFIFLLSIIVLSTMWTGCKTVTDLTKGAEERNLIRLKRGSFTEAGLYSNTYFEFEVKMPEAWTGEIDDPPDVLVVHPSSRDIAESSARKFISIITRVTRLKAGETLEDAIDRYATSRRYDPILERPSSLLGAESKKVLFYSSNENKDMKIIALFVQRGENLIVVQCEALKPLFDNVEAQFGACLESFRITGKFKPDDLTDGVLFTVDPAEDYMVHIVTTEDTPESLSLQFLGTEDRSWMIMSTNEIEKLTAGDRIKIPRFISYEVKLGDSIPLISQKILGDSKYTKEIQNYNKDIEFRAGTTVHIPLYTARPPVVGESYTDIARTHYNDEKQADHLLQYNNMEPVESLEEIKLPIIFKEKNYFYRVQSNDTLAWISRWLTGDPKNYRAIAEANNISYPYRLVVGQKLIVPARLVSDPTVFDKPIPKAKKAAPKKKDPEPGDEPKATPVPTATPKPRPIDDPGLFDLD